MVDTLEAPAPEVMRQATAESAPSGKINVAFSEGQASSGDCATYKSAAAYRNAIEAASRFRWTAGPLGMMCSSSV
jgi:hypothetical protein